MRFSLFFSLIVIFCSCNSNINNVIVPANQLPESKLVIKQGDNCYDLEITSLKLLEKSKKEVIVEYTIRNNGNIPVSIEGEKRSSADNIGIQIFFSGDEKFNRGDLLVNGIYLETPSDSDGLIPPKSAYKAQLVINLDRKTSFHSSLIMHVDPVQIYNECDETNNYTSMKF
jgi:archaellum component FlaF (FlaF/FlaG flagellin family)